MNNQKSNFSFNSRLPGWLEKMSLAVFVLFTLFLVVQTAQSAEVILGPTPSTTTISSVASTPVFTRVLTVGSSGQDVSALQAILNLETKAQLPVTGTFGSATQNAVKVFQQKYPLDIIIPAGLPASGDGIVGTTTIKKLNTLATQYNIKLSDFVPVVVSTSTAPITAFNRDLALGDTGDDVILLKTVLNSDPDTALVYTMISPAGAQNLYDEATAVAVSKFQMKYASEILTPYGLTTGTGTVGPSTRKKLNQLLNKSLTGSSTSTQTSVTPISVSKISVNPTIFTPTSPTQNQTISAGNAGEVTINYWAVGDWGSCGSNGQQTRFTAIKTEQVPASEAQTPIGPTPATSQACTYTDTTKTSCSSNNEYCTSGWRMFGWCIGGSWVCRKN
jgi:peptidoglycan hydrolase-like protein with peptidoglycan-binding domain